MIDPEDRFRNFALRAFWGEVLADHRENRFAAPDLEFKRFGFARKSGAFLNNRAPKLH